MSNLRSWCLRFTGLFDKERKDHELAEELESHLQMHIEENVRSGMSPAEARRSALVKLGGLDQVKEKVRESRGIPWLETLLQDVRFGVRMLRRNRGITAIIVLTLALGIGANTAMFSFINAVLIRSLPYGDPDRLAYVWVQNPNFPQLPLEAMGPANADFIDVQRRAHSFASLTLFAPRRFNLSIQGFAERIGGARVAGNFFSTLEVAPERGRGIQADDDEPGRERVAVIGHGLWQSEFGSDENILGRNISLDSLSYQVVGVMPEGFAYPSDIPFETGLETQVWVPIALTPQQIGDRELNTGSTIGRLRAGISAGQAEAEVSQILASLDQLHNPNLRGWYAVVRPLTESVLGKVRPQMLLLLGAASLLLLIACVNSTSLLLARGADRVSEMGMRAALGATQSRLARQMLTEALVLACSSGILGVLLARAAIPILLHFSPDNIPRLDQTSLDSHVLLFSLALAILTGILCGVFPAIVASRIDLNGLLKHDGNRRKTRTSRVGGSLVAIEVALAAVLLSGAGLLIRSFLKLQSVNAGFSATTLTMNLALDARYSSDEQRRAFFKDVADRIRRLPGTLSVGAANVLPLSNSEMVSIMTVDHYPTKKGQLIAARGVMGDYFEAMGTPLLKGRFFTEGDTPSTPRVVIINQRFAQTYFASQDPIGKRVKLGDFDDSVPWRFVVGVVADMRHPTLEDEAPAQIYVPFSQWNPVDAYLAIRTSLPPEAMISAIRSAVRAVDPGVAVADVHTMDERVSEANSRRRFQTFLLAVFGGTALFLAAIGLYGLVSYSVKQRTAEIGIRLALGAQRRDVLKLVLRQGLTLTLVGIALGLVVAFGLTRFLSSLVYGISPTDHLTFALIPVLLLAVALLACYIPARRATKVDPMEALRYE